MNIDFKHEKDRHRFLHLHPIALMILFHMNWWAQSRGLPFVVTDTVTTLAEDDYLNRASDTHRTGRAFDISIRGWSTDDIDNFMHTFKTKYNKYAAVNKHAEPVLIPAINHGNAPHFHIQIHAKYRQVIDSEILKFANSSNLLFNKDI